MFNNYSANPITNNTINAVSGCMTKTFRKSYFIRFQRGSILEKSIFNVDGGQAEIDGKNVVVLQVMLMANENFVCELIDKEDYDELFEQGEDDKNE